MADGDSYEVWDQDDHKQYGNSKWTLIDNCLFNEETRAQVKRGAAKENWKDAWVVTYASCVNTYLQNAARDINPRLKNHLRSNEAVIKGGLYLGVVCTDFADEQLSYLIYKQSFIRS